MAKKKRRGRQNSSGVYCIIFVIVILFAGVAFKSTELNKKNDEYERQIAKLEKQIKEEEKQKKELEKQEDYMETDEYVREMAKEKLNLVDKDEIVFKAKE